MTEAQELTERDWESRRELCANILQTVHRDAILMCSDEAHFHLNSCVNKQYFHYWSETNPQQVHERPLHSAQVTVWCAIAEFGIVGLYFFKERGITVTVTSDRYIEVLENFLQPQLEEMDVADAWFQQDGATAHTAQRSMQVLREMFPAKLITLRGDGWPAHSPDLAPCDFFLWGYLKSKVYTHRPENLQTLKDTLHQEIAAIPPAMTKRVMRVFRNGLEESIANDGHHLEISFLKQDDKNYFIYPFLCYNEIFCIFYRFYRINFEM